MSTYRVRAQNPRALGFFTQADHYKDFEIQSNEELEALAARLASSGFRDTESGRWIMPGAIIWVEQR